MMKPRHIPQRTCVACRQVRVKGELVRLVRTTAGLAVDTTGKHSGRGAYLCPSSQCWDDRRLKNHLEHALRIHLTPVDLQALESYRRNLLPEDSP